MDCRCAGVAQLVEQLIRNQQVSGSSPLAGSTSECGICCLPGDRDDRGTPTYLLEPTDGQNHPPLVHLPGEYKADFGY